MSHVPGSGSESPPPLPSRRVLRAMERRQETAAIPVVPPAPTIPPSVPAEPLDAPKPAARTSRAGRDLPAAIGVGLALLIVVLVGLLLYPPAFLMIVIAASALGVWEVVRAFAQHGILVPWVPLGAGVLAMPIAAYYVGVEGLLFAFVACAFAVLIWRALDHAPGVAHGVFSGVFILAWVPFLISSVLLVLREPNGPATIMSFHFDWPSQGALRVVTTLLLVVSNDTFGYLVGALFGKHPMAPKISPKKSWEGFAGSVIGAMVIGVLAALFLLHQPFWVGLVLAVGLVAASTAGDLAESMVKRELGVKDMSSILPGHGGVMDRLDSMSFAAPVAFLLFALMDWLQTL
ncbi:phosphatidate cytidylyltransferase [Psychromicrobium xiongbiense]|uniref:phosphatidate cytidylyltransferase n=1 Tax=Psychromicrobium xiongbiense TaxID=3051184 RepID=UPI002552BF70|nr:phosphatidate cytidylyltransferase [Psychromicrobium sp. YIM S02556]